MAKDIFLHLSNSVKGESQDGTHGVPAGSYAIDVLSWDWKMHQSGTTHQGGGGGGGKVEVYDMEVTKYVDAASPELIKKCCDGTHFDNAKLIVRKAGGATGAVEYLHINMNIVMITNYNTGAKIHDTAEEKARATENTLHLDRVRENLTLNFRAFEVVYVQQDSVGAPMPAAMATWDMSANLPDWSEGSPPGEGTF